MNFFALITLLASIILSIPMPYFFYISDAFCNLILFNILSPGLLFLLGKHWSEVLPNESPISML